jgi:hypothetical protein
LLFFLNYFKKRQRGEAKLGESRNLRTGNEGKLFPGDKNGMSLGEDTAQTGTPAGLLSLYMA